MANKGGTTPKIEVNIEVAKPQVFNRSSKKVLGFVIIYRLYIRIRIRRDAVKEQI